MRALRFNPLQAEAVRKMRLSFTYIRVNILDSDLWSDLHTNAAAERLVTAIRRHFADYGANITEQVMQGFVVTPELLARLRAARKH